MLSQCKDEIDILRHYSRMRWCELSMKNVNFGGYSCRVNQSGACSSSDVIRSGGRKSQTTMEDRVMVVVCGYPELYDTTSYFYKNRNTFCNETGAAAEAPPMTRIHVCCVVNVTREWSEFHARMKRVNSKCSSVQLRANSVIYSLHSRLVWTHLKRLEWKQLISSANRLKEC